MNNAFYPFFQTVFLDYFGFSSLDLDVKAAVTVPNRMLTVFLEIH